MWNKFRIKIQMAKKNCMLVFSDLTFIRGNNMNFYVGYNQLVVTDAEKEGPKGKIRLETATGGCKSLKTCMQTVNCNQFKFIDCIVKFNLI